MRKRTGSVDCIGPNRYRARVTGKYLGTFPTEEEAQREVNLALHVLSSRTVTQTLFQEVVEAWIKRRDLDRIIVDSDNEMNVFETHIKGTDLGLTPVRSLCRSDIKDWVGEMSRKKPKRKTARTSDRLRRQTIVNAYNIINGCLKAACDDGKVKENYARDIIIPKERRTDSDKVWTYLTPEEQRKILAAYDGVERHIIGFAIGTGVRSGELVSLELSDVHLDRVDPYIIVRYGGKGRKVTKNGRIRRVDLFGIGLSSLKLWLAALPTFAKKNPRNLVFPRKRGGQREDDHVLAWTTWKSIVKRAGITRPFRWHDLRHTCASSLVSGWWGRVWSLAEVQELLGHSERKTTERYCHVAGTVLSRAAAETRLASLATA